MLLGVEDFYKAEQKNCQQSPISLPVHLEIYPAVEALLLTPHRAPLTSQSMHFTDQSCWTLHVIYVPSFLTIKYNEQLGISLGYGNGMQSGTTEEHSSSLPNRHIAQTKTQSLER